MAGIWSIIVPQKAEYTNLVTNPSLETGAGGYTAVGGSTTLARQVGGAYGLYYLLVTPGSGVNDGVYYGTVGLVNGITYTFSVELMSEINLKIYFADTSGTQKGTATQITNANPPYWKRYSVTWKCDSTASYRLYIVKDNISSVTDFRVDGLSVIAGSDEITYFDGDTDNCRWVSTPHASQSIVNEQARNVGRVIDLENYNLRVLSVDGAGMVEATHKIVQNALLPGANYKGHKVQPRVLLLTSGIYGTNLENLHLKRENIIDLFKHDLVAGDQPVTLRYTGANSQKPIDIKCYIDTETASLTNPKTQVGAIRLIAYDPYFYDVYDQAQSLTSVGSGTRRYFAAKRNGAWTTITPSAVTDPGSGIRVRDIAIAGSYYKKRWLGDPGSTGFQAETMYVSGLFLNWDGNANADYIAKYDFNTGSWGSLGTGANGYVRKMAVAPDGKLYVCGEFTSIGGVAANRVAYWDGTNWNAMGSGFDGTAYDIMIGADGNVYAVGNDSTIGGVTGAAYIAYWDGTNWNAMGSGLGNVAYCLDKDEAGNIYVGGAFTGYVSKWDGSSFTSLSASYPCWAIKAHPNGMIYAGFSGGDHIYAYNGKSWISLAGGVNGNYVWSIDIDRDGIIWVGGDFTLAGGKLTVNGLVCWNGYNWLPPDINLPGTATGQTVKCVGNDLYLGFDTSGTATYSYQNYYITNNGTSRAYPKLIISVTGTKAILKYLRNESTGATLYFDYTIVPGETLTIDFRESIRGIYSSFYGNRISAMLRGSQFTEFYLLPGFNLISLYIQPGGATVTTTIQWKDRYESIDGAAA